MTHRLENNINRLVDSLMTDYGLGRDIDSINPFSHPHKKTVVELIEKLRSIIYPGIFRSSSYKYYTIRNHISMLMEDVLYNLIEQISAVLKYTDEVPEFAFREKVRGGLTGYAQVYGKYNTTALDKLKLDISYITNYSLMLDVQIILETIKVIFQKESTEGFSEEQKEKIQKKELKEEKEKKE